jgi:hypothetical protein
MRTLVISILLFIITAGQLWAKERSKTYKNHTVYLYGALGRSWLTEPEMSVKVKDKRQRIKKIEHESNLSHGHIAGFGIIYNVFCLEFIYGNLGNPVAVFKEQYSVSQDTTLVGGGFRWIFSSISFKLGYASYKSHKRYTIQPNGTQQLTIAPAVSTERSGGAYAGFGFNYDLGTNLEAILDISWYGWKNDPVFWTVDQEPDRTVGGEMTIIGLASLGLRLYF